MRIFTIIFTSLFLLSGAALHADSMRSSDVVYSPSSAFDTWTAGDHMGAAKRYEEEARLLQAEARGMESAEARILPYLEVQAVQQSGISKLVDRRIKESEEKMKLASWHHQEALRLIAMREASESAQPPIKDVGQSGTKKDPYVKYDWLQDEHILGW